MNYSVIDLQKEIIEIYEKFRKDYLKYAKRIKEFAEELYKDNFLFLIVFRSMVKGNYKPWSDIDIGIILKRKIDEFERIKILKRIREEFGEINPFEVHFFTKEEFERKKNDWKVYNSMNKIYKIWRWFLRKKQSEILIKIAKKSLNPFKEITENLLVFWNEIKNEKALVLELCSGSRALVSLFNVLYNQGVSIAVDMRSPVSIVKNFEKIGRFYYIQSDLFDRSLEEKLKGIIEKYEGYKKILVGLHCCKMLSPRSIDIGFNLKFDKIVLVPCCVEKTWAEKILNRKFERYEDWIEALRKYLEMKGYETKVYKEISLEKEEYFVIGKLPCHQFKNSKIFINGK